MIPMIILALILLGVGGYSFWVFIQAMSAIVQILSVVIVILIAPFLVKLMSDIILYYKFGISKYVSFIIGVALSIPILLVLYMNIGVLIVFGMIIGIAYFGARFYFSKKGKKQVGSILKWFEEMK